MNNKKIEESYWKGFAEGYEKGLKEKLRPVDHNFSDYLSVGEAASFLGVTKNTLRNWEEAGKIKTLRHPYNRYRLYKKEDLETMLKIRIGE